MKRLFMVLFGLASLHAAATAAKTAGEEKIPGKNAGAAASLWPEKMDPSFQGSRPECFKIWVIRNLRFPADRYDVGDEAKVEVVFAIDKNGTLTDLKVTHCEERHFADRLCKTIALSPKWSPGRTKGKPVKTELEMRFVFRLVAPPAGQEELGLCAEECDIHTTADRMPLFCGGGPDGFRAWVQRQVDSLMGPGALTEPRKLILRFVVGKDGRVTPAPNRNIGTRMLWNRRCVRPLPRLLRGLRRRLTESGFVSGSRCRSPSVPGPPERNTAIKTLTGWSRSCRSSSEAGWINSGVG